MKRLLANIIIFLLIHILFVQCDSDTGNKAVNKEYSEIIENNNKIILSEICGYYEYLNYKYNDLRRIDTLRCKVQFVRDFKNSFDIVKYDLLDLMLTDSNGISGIWSVDSINSTLIPKPYKFYNVNLKAGDTWRTEDELDSESGTFEWRFKCLSKDTTLIPFPGYKFENITLIEKRIWQDVGGVWCIIEYGFNKNHQIVYKKNYCEEGLSSVPETLFINEYLPNDHFKSKSESKNWLAKHQYSLAVHDSLSDYLLYYRNLDK